MYSRPMMPKQVDSIFDLLESYECEEITLRRLPPTSIGGRLQSMYTLSVEHQGEHKEWSDHALPRLMATAVTQITAANPWPDDVEVSFIVPQGR